MIFGKFAMHQPVPQHAGVNLLHLGSVNEVAGEWIPAVLLLVILPKLQDSCGEDMSIAANFLQKQQKQRGNSPDLSGEGPANGAMTGQASARRAAPVRHGRRSADPPECH
jgi:hypothetical protein